LKLVMMVAQKSSYRQQYQDKIEWRVDKRASRRLSSGARWRSYCHCHSGTAVHDHVLPRDS